VPKSYPHVIELVRSEVIRQERKAKRRAIKLIFVPIDAFASVLAISCA
jgi:hypothetical protein